MKVCWRMWGEKWWPIDMPKVEWGNTRKPIKADAASLSVRLSTSPTKYPI
jgi:hypothetical protein